MTKRIQSGTAGAGQSMDDANFELTAIRKSDDLPIPRVRQLGGGSSSGIMKVYQGPFPGLVRDPGCPFSMSGRNQMIQHGTPATTSKCWRH